MDDQPGTVALLVDEGVARLHRCNGARHGTLKSKRIDAYVCHHVAADADFTAFIAHARFALQKIEVVVADFIVICPRCV